MDFSRRCTAMVKLALAVYVAGITGMNSSVAFGASLIDLAEQAGWHQVPSFRDNNIDEDACDDPAGCTSEEDEIAEAIAPACGNGTVDSGEKCDDGNQTNWDGCTKCIPDDPNCRAVETSNNLNANTLNIVFVTFGVDPANMLSTVRQYASNLRSLRPISSNGNKIQFWYSPLVNTIGKSGKSGKFGKFGDICIDYCNNSNVTRQCPKLAHRKIAVLCNTNCRGFATFGGTSYTGMQRGYWFVGPVVFVHEFGHQWGWLRDEYIEPLIGSWAGGVNCAPSMAAVQAAKPGNPLYLWKILRGTTGYDGCSYVSSNKRPHNISLMGTPMSSEYGPVNEAELANRLQVYGNNPDYIGLAPPVLPGGSLVAQLIEPESDRFVEHALRITLERQLDGTFAIVSREAITVPHGVVPTFEQGNVVTVRMGGQEFTQTFSSETISVADGLDAQGQSHDTEMFVEPRKSVTVDIGLGRLSLIDAQSVEVSIEPCDSTDGISENDCPIPMFRGEDLSYPPEVMQHANAKKISTRLMLAFIIFVGALGSATAFYVRKKNTSSL